MSEKVQCGRGDHVRTSGTQLCLSKWTEVQIYIFCYIKKKSRLIDTYIFPSNLFFAPVNLETVIKSSVFESSECLILKEQVFKKEEKKMALGAGQVHKMSTHMKKMGEGKSKPQKPFCLISIVCSYQLIQKLYFAKK